MGAGAGAVSIDLAARAGPALLLLVVGVVALRVKQVTPLSTTAMDFLPFLQAGDAVLVGATPFAITRFLYPPFAALLATAAARVDPSTWQYLIPTIHAMCVIALVGLSARLVGLSPLSRVAALVVLVLFLPGSSLGTDLWLGNIDIVLFVALPVVLLLWSAGRWRSGGVLLGVTAAVKPVLLPFMGLAVVTARWRALLAGAGVALGLNLIAAAAVPEPLRWFSQTVPFVLSGQDEFSQPWDGSLLTSLTEWGVDAWLVTTARVAVTAATLVAAWLHLRWAEDRSTLGLIQGGSLLYIGALLAGSPAFARYFIALVPLVMTVVYRDAWARVPWLWLPFVPLAVGWGAMPLEAGRLATVSFLSIWAVMLLLVVRDLTRQRPGVTSDPGSARRVLATPVALFSRRWGRE